MYLRKESILASGDAEWINFLWEEKIPPGALAGHDVSRLIHGRFYFRNSGCVKGRIHRMGRKRCTNW